MRPLGLAPEVWRDAQGVGALALAPPEDDTMETVIQNLEGLLVGIPDYMEIEEVPRASQIHTVGVEPRMHLLSRRVTQAAMYYREHNPPQ